MAGDFYGFQPISKIALATLAKWNRCGHTHRRVTLNAANHRRSNRTATVRGLFEAIGKCGKRGIHAGAADDRTTLD